MKIPWNDRIQTRPQSQNRRSLNRPLADRELEPLPDAWIGLVVVIAATALPILGVLLLLRRWLP